MRSFLFAALLASSPALAGEAVKMGPLHDALQSVDFGTGLLGPSTQSMDALNDVAEALIAHPQLHIQLRPGSDAPGLQLTRHKDRDLARAEAVRDVLVEAGVPSERILVLEYGRHHLDIHGWGVWVWSEDARMAFRLTEEPSESGDHH